MDLLNNKTTKKIEIPDTRKVFFTMFNLENKKLALAS